MGEHKNTSINFFKLQIWSKVFDIRYIVRTSAREKERYAKTQYRVELHADFDFYFQSISPLLCFKNKTLVKIGDLEFTPGQILLIQVPGPDVLQVEFTRTAA